MRKHKILSRKYISIMVKLVSPISISNGENENTDSDIMLNGKGEFFIPGSSLAGAFRSYLGVEKNKDCVYGFAEQENGRMSSIFISDLFFPYMNTTKSVRDGVKLSSDKTVDNKFDMEIIEPGIDGVIKLEIVVREGDSYDYDAEITRIVSGLQSGEIRIGANKNRGFGRIEVSGIYERTFDKNTRTEWITFCKTADCTKKAKYVPYDEWIKEKPIDCTRYIKASLSLSLKGGISIRKYSAKPGKVDYEHITCNGKPVIPGTSWNGAVRSDVIRILNALGIKDRNKINNIINQWFGYVLVENQKPKDRETSEPEEAEKASQSKIVISESIIEGAKPVPMTRNKINRFTAGTKDGSLYSEISYFDGKTNLEFMVKKDEGSNYKALLGMMMLVSSDISKGYVAVGGQVGIGRGIFSENPDDPKLHYSEEVNEDECMTELYELVKENKG